MHYEGDTYADECGAQPNPGIPLQRLWHADCSLCRADLPQHGHNEPCINGPAQVLRRTSTRHPQLRESELDNWVSRSIPRFPDIRQAEHDAGDANRRGLAYLGGGSLAAGGLGMVGGTLVVAAGGSLLGTALGAGVVTSYVRDDDSFHVELLQAGTGLPVVVCNGFLSEEGRGWDEWRDMVLARYPRSSVFRLHWGAKELGDLAVFAGVGAAKATGGVVLRQAALRATRFGAKRLAPVAPVLAASDAAANPWALARARADKTGIVLADLLTRTEQRSFVLLGHSLGARVMVGAAQALAANPTGPRLNSVHLLGAAIGAKGDWADLVAGVEGPVFNYHSRSDNVLKFLYAAAQGGQAAAGCKGMKPLVAGLTNIDVTDEVADHTAYFSRVHLR